MSTKIVKRSSKGITVQVSIEFSGNMLESEEQIQKALNKAGSLATAEALSQFDADGDPIVIGGVRMTSKCRSTEKYQTPYGATTVKRHLYQTSKGGRSYCPLESGARMVLNSTPRYAKMISFKYASNGANMVARDFEESHGRKVSRGYLKNIADFIGNIAQAKEETWEYELPDFEVPPACISIGLDGTCMLLKEDGWREAMTGTIAFYDRSGKRFHTIYTGAPPEYGKQTFKERFSREIERVQARYPNAHYQGLADGAVDNWDFLKPFVHTTVLDFFHASEYVGNVAKAAFSMSAPKREEWLEMSLHNLKHKKGAAKRLLNEMDELRQRVVGKEKKKVINTAVTYFENNYKKMSYASNVNLNRPIGSGVTEAACKVLIKQRLANSGMRWKGLGAGMVLSIRALVLTNERWGVFWKKLCNFSISRGVVEKPLKFFV
jgi:hypothetical protein